jgi:hypothetical protein
VQVKVWLDGMSPMTWRRVQLPGSIMLRELHGVIQVAMDWEGLHLYRFLLRAGQYGSSELVASSPNVSLAALRMRRGPRCCSANFGGYHRCRLSRPASATPRSSPACRQTAAGSGGFLPAVPGGFIIRPPVFTSRCCRLISDQLPTALGSASRECRYEQATDDESDEDFAHVHVKARVPPRLITGARSRLAYRWQPPA